MILQIYCGKNPEPYKDVLCMKHEYDQYIASLELCRIPYNVTADSLVDGTREINMSVEETSLVNDYFY